MVSPAMLVFFGLTAAQMASANEPGFDYASLFVEETMRVDLFHTGNGTTDVFMVDQIKKEGAWPGSKKNLIDPLGMGKYRYVVLDKATGKPIFSKGFCSMFGEWQTTDEAIAGTWKAFHESMLFPYPKAPVTLVIETRDAKGEFTKELFKTDIDPSHYTISTVKPFADAEIDEIAVNGDPATTVDIVILGDGYTLDQQEKFEADTARFAEAFFSWSPFKENGKKISIRAVHTISEDSGPSDPRKGVFTSTALSTSFDTFGSARYLTTTDNKTMRDYAALVPYDAIYIIVNTSTYGGAGIYNLFAIWESDNEYDEYVMIHEFGHSFGGLADEYYTSQIAYSEFYPKGVEPWEPNITALLDPKNPKWQSMMTGDMPVPTPEDKAHYGAKVGVYEGAGYAAKGLFRPMIDCKMFSKGNVPFCPVCMASIEKVIAYYTE